MSPFDNICSRVAACRLSLACRVLRPAQWAGVDVPSGHLPCTWCLCTPELTAARGLAWDQMTARCTEARTCLPASGSPRGCWEALVRAMELSLPRSGHSVWASEPGFPSVSPFRPCALCPVWLWLWLHRGRSVADPAGGRVRKAPTAGVRVEGCREGSDSKGEGGGGLGRLRQQESWETSFRSLARQARQGRSR